MPLPEGMGREGPWRADGQSQGPKSLCWGGPGGSGLRLVGCVFCVLFFSQSFKYVETILISSAVQKQAAGRV